MKKLIFAIAVLLIIIGVGVAEQLYLRDLFGDLKDKAESVRTMVETKDAECYDKTVEMQEWWDNKKHVLEAVVSHNETKEITIRLAELEGYVAIDDQKSSEATIAIIIELCENSVHILGIDWDTIL